MDATTLARGATQDAQTTPGAAATGCEQLRRQAVALQPWWYNPYLHLGLPAAFGLATIALALASIRDLRAWEVLAVPLTWLLNNATEWRVHRDLLHKRSRIAPILYDKHTPLHHRLYITGDMSIRNAREYPLVLLPGFAIVLILLVVLPPAALMRLAGLPNVAALFVATDLAYVLSYEWLHLAYHLPPESRIGRLGLIRVLRRHHALHHDPRLMQRWNFNVTVPLWDWIRGTIYREPGSGNSPPAAH